MSKGNDNSTLLPPLAILEGATKGKKRRYRLPDSRNRSKYQARRICQDTVGANLTFESAFRHVLATPVVVAPPREAKVVLASSNSSSE